MQQPVAQTFSAWEIRNRDSQQDCQDALPRQNQHCNPDEDQKETYEVAGNDDDEPQDRMLTTERLVFVFEMIGRQANHDPARGPQPDDGDQE